MKHLSDALRLLAGRAPRNPEATLSPRAILALFLSMALLNAAVQWLVAGDQAEFSLYGVNALIAWLAISLGVIALFTRRDESAPVTRNLVLLWAGATSLPLAATAVMARLLAQGSLKAGLAVGIGSLLLSVLSAVLGGRQVFKNFSRWPTWRGVGFAAILWIAVAALPNWPVFLGSDFVASRANLWEAIAYSQQREPSAAEKEARAQKRREALTRVSGVEAAQPYLLDAELAKLAPRAPKKPNLFVVGVAGWSEQKVFLKETDASLDIIRKRLHAEGRTISLINNTMTADARPIADIHNLSHVLRSVAAKMNPEEDVLLLTMTSHGSQEGFALEYGPLVARTLSPQTLRALLDAAGIKNRIVIVSACHAGVFIPVLSDPRTMVIAAARAERTSFGCADDRDWTYFGDAFFAHGLNEAPNLSEAFVKARDLVGQWEQAQKATPSEPQIFVGEELRRRFPALVGPAQAMAESAPIRETRKETPATGGKPL